MHHSESVLTHDASYHFFSHLFPFPSTLPLIYKSFHVFLLFFLSSCPVLSPSLLPYSPFHLNTFPPSLPDFHRNYLKDSDVTWQTAWDRQEKSSRLRYLAEFTQWQNRVTSKNSDSFISNRIFRFSPWSFRLYVQCAHDLKALCLPDELDSVLATAAKSAQFCLALLAILVDAVVNHWIPIYRFLMTNDTEHLSMILLSITCIFFK